MIAALALVLAAQLRPISPQGNAIIVRASADQTSGRGGFSRFFPAGYLAWTGETYEAGGVPKPYIPAPPVK